MNFLGGTLILPRLARLLISMLGIPLSLISNGQYLTEADSLRNIRVKLKGKKILVLPAVIKSIETGWGGGIAGSYFFRTDRVHDSLLRTSNIEGLGLYTERNQFVAALGVNIYFPDEKYILHWRNTFSHYPDKFWGYGNDTPLSNEENYVFTQFFINPQFVRKVFHDFYVGASYELQHVFNFEYTEGGIFDQQNITGRYGGTASGPGLILSWDSRDNAFSSAHGSFLQFSVNDFRKIFFSDFNYVSYVLDFRKYLSMWKHDVIAFQSYTHLNSGNVPIRNMAILGGSDIMRGYYEGRFTDYKMTAFQVEYRKHIWKRFGVVAFGGYGQVFNNVHQLSWRSLKCSFGGGFRFAVNQKERLNLRLDYGIGENSQGWYFSIREAF